MPFLVVQPPKEEAQLAEVGKELVQAVKKMGQDMNVEGFLMAWVSGTRVIVERDQTGEIVGIALVAVGQRWIPNDFSATVMFFYGSDELHDFMLQITSALGAQSLFKQGAMLTRGQKQSTYEIIQYHLQ